DAAYRALACFEPYDEDPHQYAWATRMVPASCEDEVVELLTQLRRAAPADPADDDEARFAALLNAEIVADAERYYRSMLRAHADHAGPGRAAEKSRVGPPRWRPGGRALRLLHRVPTGVVPAPARSSRHRCRVRPAARAHGELRAEPHRNAV